MQLFIYVYQLKLIPPTGNIKDIGTVVGYPVHKEGKVLHKVLLNMQIPIEDLMKISNFTIASNNE